jgi:hypothetical protein
MLMALLLAALLGGGSTEFFSSDELRAVEQVIEDETRVMAAMQIMTRINSRYAAILDQRRAAAGQLATLDGDMYAPADAYSAVLAQLWQQRSDATNGYIRDVFELRRHVTREEWAAIFDAPDE